MGTYSIKELEKLSGIKAHTIRIWEKRYNLINPSRTTTNIRTYSDDDLKKIINVSALNSHGLKISAIARLSDRELQQRVYDLSTGQDQMVVNIDTLITSMLDLNEQKFVDDLNTLERKYGFEITITEIVYPFLSKIGILWQTGTITPAHEHFISNLIRQRIIVAIDSLPVPDDRIRMVLFLPENELHEIGLLFSHYVARKMGIKTYYLGQSVPFGDLVEVYKIHKPHILITHITSFPAPQNLNEYIQRLCDEFPSSWVFASGSVLKRTSVRYPKNFKSFESLLNLKQLLTEF